MDCHRLVSFQSGLSVKNVAEPVAKFVTLRLDIASSRRIDEAFPTDVTPVAPAEVRPTNVTPVTLVTADALKLLHDMIKQDTNVLHQMSTDYLKRRVQKLASAAQV
jgi:hypothetical protein